MPRLPLEPCLYPDGLLDGELPDSPGASWWVLHTKPRAEKALARRFVSERVGFFLPLARKPRKHRGREQPAYLPLFPGYVFLFGDDESRVQALRTNQIVNCLPVKDQRQLHGDLQNVFRLVGSDSELEVEQRLTRWTPVTIIAGPFSGMAGKVLQHRGQTRFAVEVHFLQQAVTIEIESWMMEPVSPTCVQTE